LNCHIFAVKIRRIYISAGHNFLGHKPPAPDDFPTLEVTEVECVAGKGLRGDRYFGFKPDYKGQVTFIASEVFEDTCTRLGVKGISPGVTRRNIVTSGVDLNTLAGRRFEVQGVKFEGMEECSPCRWMNAAIAPGAEAVLCGQGGLRAKVLSDGILRVDK
jgi:MOSC domain-containing protein YiiM